MPAWYSRGGYSGFEYPFKRQKAWLNIYHDVKKGSCLQLSVSARFPVMTYVRSRGRKRHTGQVTVKYREKKKAQNHTTYKEEEETQFC